MKLKIEQILDLPGSARNFSGKLDLSWVKRRSDALFPGLLSIGGEIENRAGIVSLRYRAEGSMAYRCERCMKSVDHHYLGRFSHIVVRALEDEQLEDEYLTASGGVLDLAEIAGSDILLSLPQVLLCGEDCKGLCPRCGADLNEGSCGCLRTGSYSEG